MDKWERPKVMCEVCKRKYSPSIYRKWHGEKCKFKIKDNGNISDIKSK